MAVKRMKLKENIQNKSYNRFINENYDYYNYDVDEKYISLLNNITDYIDRKAGRLVDPDCREFKDFTKSLIAYIIEVYEPLD